MDRTIEDDSLPARQLPRKSRKTASCIYDDHLSPIQEERFRLKRSANRVQEDTLSDRYSADIESNSNRTSSLENSNDQTMDDLENGLRHSFTEPHLYNKGPGGHKLFSSCSEESDAGERTSVKAGGTTTDEGATGVRESLLPAVKSRAASEEMRDDPVRGIVYYLVHTVLLTV